MSRAFSEKTEELVSKYVVLVATIKGYRSEMIDQQTGEWVPSNDSNVGVPTRMVEEQRKFLLHAKLCECHHN